VLTATTIGDLLRRGRAARVGADVPHLTPGRGHEEGGNISELIGRTPLVRLNRISDETGRRCWASSSRSTRAGRQRPHRPGDDRRGRARRTHRPGRTTLIEPTSGTPASRSPWWPRRALQMVLTMPDSIGGSGARCSGSARASSLPPAPRV
jgi:hypothetical protein